MPSNFHPETSLAVLVVDDEANIRLTLSMCIEADGHRVVTAATITEALDATARQAFDLMFLDLRLGMDNGLDFIPQLLKANPWTRIVVITAYASVDTAVEAMKRGASDYLPKPFEAAQVQHVTQKVAERRQLERRVEALQSAMGQMDPEADLPTSDPTMMTSLELARRLARSRANLVIRGELGVGKARLAKAIHVWGDRANEPFAVVACRKSSEETVQHELFGSPSQPGKVDTCDGGTLVLKDIDALPMSIQADVVRLLKDREYERRDETLRRRADVRIIATTRIDLDEWARLGNFRSDLMLAINVVQIDVPPLRNRPNDIPLLAARYLAYFTKQNHRSIAGFTPQAMYTLMQHRWPGNVRELRNVVERAVLLCEAELIGVEHLPPNLLNTHANVSIGDLVPLATIEELHIRRVVDASESLRHAASVLGIDPATLGRRVKRFEANANANPPK